MSCFAHTIPTITQIEFAELVSRTEQGRASVPHELAALLQAAQPYQRGVKLDLENPDYDVDVLIIGGGGAGASAAIEADKAGARRYRSSPSSAWATQTQ